MSAPFVRALISASRASAISAPTVHAIVPVVRRRRPRIRAARRARLLRRLGAFHHGIASANTLLPVRKHSLCDVCLEIHGEADLEQRGYRQLSFDEGLEELLRFAANRLHRIEDRNEESGGEPELADQPRRGGNYSPNDALGGDWHDILRVSLIRRDRVRKPGV